MKKTMMVVIAIVALFFTVAVASANTAARIRLNIPFAFYVDRDLLPAGEYIFEVCAMSPYASTSSALFIRSLDNTAAKWAHTIPGWNSRNLDQGLAYFSRYADKYFLSKVEYADHQVNLKKSKAEKELSARVGGVQEKILLAMQ